MVDGILHFLLTVTHEYSRQDMLAGLNKATDTKRSTPPYPYVPGSHLFRLRLRLAQHWEATPSFEDFCSAKETQFCTANFVARFVFKLSGK